MDNQNKSRFLSLIYMWILGVALIISAFALIGVLQFDTSRLSLFGPTAKIYFFGIRDGLISGVCILLLAFILLSFFEKKVQNIQSRLKNFYASSSKIKQNLLVLILCFLFVFASNGTNVIMGYFNMDDFEIAGLNHSLPFSQSVLMPHGNDHAFPLFITEMKILDILFGQNPVPYNLFFFALFPLIPFFVYLIFKKLKLGMVSFMTFLIIFAGAAGWTEIITGFYIMSIYPQILLFFSIASWAYLAWTQSKAAKYMVIFAIALIFALASDTSGIWVIPVIILFMIGTHYFKKNIPQMQKVLVPLEAAVAENEKNQKV